MRYAVIWPAKQSFMIASSIWPKIWTLRNLFMESIAIGGLRLLDNIIGCWSISYFRSDSTIIIIIFLGSIFIIIMVVIIIDWLTLPIGAFPNQIWLKVKWSQVKSWALTHDYIIMVLLMLSFLLWFDDNAALIFEHNYEVNSWGSQLSLLFCSCYHFCWMTTQLWSSSTIMKSTHGAYNYHYYFVLVIIFVGWQHSFDLLAQLWSQLMGLSAQRHRRLDINDANIISRLDCITKSQPKQDCNCQNEKHFWNKNKIWSQPNAFWTPAPEG